MNTTSGQSNTESFKNPQSATGAMGAAKSSDGKEMKTDMHTEGESVVRKGLHRAGDLLEEAGRELEKKGYKKLGEAIAQVGNSIEHLGE